MDVRYRNNRKVWVAGLIFYMILICIVSLKPAPEHADTPWVKEMLHNFCHVPAYAGLAFMLIGVLRVFAERERVFAKAFFFSVFYGIIMEVFQGLVPGRTLSLLDMGLNTLGALITIFLVQKGILTGFFSDPCDEKQ